MPPSDSHTHLTPEEAGFRGILSDHALRYPRMEIQDLYKLIFQASFGSEHAVTSPSDAEAWLTRELAALGQGPEEPIVDPISPDGRLVRMHLRPFIAARGEPNGLLEAFMRTARDYHGTVRMLYRLWGYAEHMAAAGLLPFSRDALREFFAERQARGFPAVHHSEVYAQTYRPAYRVVHRRFMTGMP
jgi:hypothetical protein